MVHFIGLMPENMLRQSQITGIEIDSVTARLAKQLYPDADIRRQPFEETRLADSFFDVAISNIPFGDYVPFDARFKQWKFVIHDYFFAATLEKVRPGGLILFVTSKGTLDKVEGGLRELISQQADLLGAIRLPNDAFKKNANTEVTTDIVMLRKRLPGETPKGPAWKALGEITNSFGEKIALNEYFVAHPEMMLGEMRLEGGRYRIPFDDTSSTPPVGMIAQESRLFRQALTPEHAALNLGGVKLGDLLPYAKKEVAHAPVAHQSHNLYLQALIRTATNQEKDFTGDWLRYFERKNMEWERGNFPGDLAGLKQALKPPRDAGGAAKPSTADTNQVPAQK